MLVWLKVFPSGLRGLEVTLTVLQAPHAQGSITAQHAGSPSASQLRSPPLGPVQQRKLGQAHTSFEKHALSILARLTRL